MITQSPIEGRLDILQEMVYKDTRVIDEFRCLKCRRLLCKHITGTLEIKCKCGELYRIIVAP